MLPIWLVLAAGGGVLAGYVWRMVSEQEGLVVTPITRSRAWTAYQTMKTLADGATPNTTGTHLYVQHFLEDVCLDLQLIRVVELIGPEGEALRREVLRGN